MLTLIWRLSWCRTAETRCVPATSRTEVPRAPYLREVPSPLLFCTEGCWRNVLTSITGKINSISGVRYLGKITIGNSLLPVNSPHKGQWCGALMFSLICIWTNGWVNNRNSGDLRRHRTHYDVTVLGLPGILEKWDCQHLCPTNAVINLSFAMTITLWIDGLKGHITNVPTRRFVRMCLIIILMRHMCERSSNFTCYSCVLLKVNRHFLSVKVFYSKNWVIFTSHTYDNQNNNEAPVNIFFFHFFCIVSRLFHIVDWYHTFLAAAGIQDGGKQTDNRLLKSHDDVIKRKHFPRYWPFVRGIHRSPASDAEL